MPAEPKTAASPAQAGNRAGYVIAVIVNLVLWWLINRTPGWQSLPWITESFEDVLWVVNLSLFASVAANVAYLFFDRPRFKALCQLVISLIGLWATVLLLTIFPFDFTGYSVPWAIITRIILVIAVVGSAISVVVQVVRLVRGRRH